MKKIVSLFLLFFISILPVQTVSAVKSSHVKSYVHKHVESLLRDSMSFSGLNARTRLKIELKTVSTILFFLSIQYDLGSISSDIGDFPCQFLLLDAIGYLDSKLYAGEKGYIGVNLMMLDCYNIMRKICDNFEELSDMKKRIPDGISKLDWNEKTPHLRNLIEIEQKIFDVMKNNRVIDSIQMDSRKKVCFNKLMQQINHKSISDKYLKRVITDSSHFQFKIFQRLLQDLEVKIQDPECDFTKLYNWYKKIYTTHLCFVV